MADPLDFETRNTVASSTGLTVLAGIALEQEILDSIDRYYGQTAKSEAEIASPVGESEDLEHLRDMASEAPVIRLVNAMIAQAVEKRASDIHIEPFEKEFRVRYRVDRAVLFFDDHDELYWNATGTDWPVEIRRANVYRVKHGKVVEVSIFEADQYVVDELLH